jgi:hypothetical protein
VWVEAEAFAVEEDGSFDVSSVRKPPTRVLMGMILLFISSATESEVLWFSSAPHFSGVS